MEKTLVAGKQHLEGWYAPSMMALASCAVEYETKVFPIRGAMKLTQSDVAHAMRDITTSENPMEGVQPSDIFELIDLDNEVDVVLEF